MRDIQPGGRRGPQELRQVDIWREKDLAFVPRPPERGQTGVLLTGFEAGGLRSRMCRLAETSPHLSSRARGLASTVLGPRASLPQCVCQTSTCPAEPGPWPQKGPGTSQDHPVKSGRRTRTQDP